MTSHRVQFIPAISEVPEETRTFTSVPFESDLTIATIRDWVTECLNAHEKCAPGSTIQDSPPKRLLHVRETPHEPLIRLVEIGASQQIPRYFALSHCWGDQHVCQTTSNTRASHQEDIPLSSLNYTFRDAISLVIRLSAHFGINHIWIDSLCIIQDSKEDWETEAAKMASIYENAFLVIAATGAVDGRSGFFQQPRFPLVRILHKRVLLNNRLLRNPNTFYAYTHDLFISDLQNTDYLSEGGLTYRIFHENPLFTRAWALQERLLATRCLHFTRTEVILECKSGVRCECGAFQRRGEEWQLESPEKMEFESFANRSKSDTHLAWENWWCYVERFSDRCLTKYSDVLPAIGGIARKVAGEDLGGYVAGMWTKDLIHNLLWNVDEAGPPLHRSTARYSDSSGPSWSWISTNPGLRVNFRRSYSSKRAYPTVAIAEVVDVSCEQSGPDPYGKVDRGSLNIRGYTIETVATRVEDSNFWWLHQTRWPEIERSFIMWPDGDLLAGLDTLEPGTTVLKCLLVATETERHIYRAHGAESIAPFPYLYESMQQRRWRRKEGFIKTYRTIKREKEDPVQQYRRYAEDLDADFYYGLVLLPLNGSDGLYRRIGICRFPTSPYAKLIESETGGDHVETLTIM